MAPPHGDPASITGATGRERVPVGRGAEAHVIELHLIGYTADLEHLVLDVDPERERGEYKLLIDADLFVTLDEIRAGRRAAGMETGEDEPVSNDPVTQEPADEEPVAEEPAAEEPADEEPVAEEPAAEEPAADEPAEEEPAAEEPVVEEPVVEEPVVEGPAGPIPDPGLPEPDARTPRNTKLSPAQIQDLLRRGRSVRSVARAAGTDREWIERWLPPIEAERQRILEAAWSRRLERPRLGRSREPLREAVERSLRDRRVPPDDAVWSAARRASGTWSVAVRFTHRGRNRTATWTYDPAEGRLGAASESARDLGFTRPRSRRSR